MSLTFFAKTIGASEQLWVSDGTLAGSHVVKTFTVNPIGLITMIGARAYFVVNDGVHGSELWVSDGTAAGTVLLKDINPGAGSSAPINLTNINGTLFFTADDGTHGYELWQSDGTAAGTVMVKDIFPGSTGANPGSLANLNGTLFFSANDGAHGHELWTSDGTAAGTVMVKDIRPGPIDSFPVFLTSVNGTLLFGADDGTHGFELWSSDGTAAGTVLVKDIWPGSNTSLVGGTSNFLNINGTLFFEANDGTHGLELWKSDSTTTGTVLVKDIQPGGTDSSPHFFANVNGTLFFYADDGIHGFELWKSDGTTAGTVMVKDIQPGSGNSIPTISTPFVGIGSTLYFTANDGVFGSELWKSDGTAAGTVMVKDIIPGGAGSSPFDMTNVNGMLEFYAFDGSSFGLYRSDGTAAGTIEIAQNIDTNALIGFTPQPAADDFNGDHLSDLLWRNTSGALAGWSMNGGSIVSGSSLTSGGAVVAPDSSWSVAGISDFNGDGNADLLWRATDGTVASWTMNGSVITSSNVVSLGGVAVKPDASWSIAGTGDFDGDSRADILWRNTGGSLVLWTMNGGTIMSSSAVTAGGAAVTPDASWSVAGVGDFNGDNRRDILWRNASGEVTAWFMNGATISGSADLTSGGAAVRPDASWSVAGIGDFDHDGNSDILWRNSSGALSEWLMNGSTIAGGGAITSGGVAVTPDATWHIVEIGDFNSDGSSDILWRNDNGALSEWLMNGTTISQSVTPASGGSPVSPASTWTIQTKPTDFG
jgi:ELWxxDGT repeat protein